MFARPMNINSNYDGDILLYIYIADPEENFSLYIRNLTKRMHYYKKNNYDVYWCTLNPLLSITNILDDAREIKAEGIQILIRCGANNMVLYTTGIYTRIKEPVPQPHPILGIFMYDISRQDIAEIKMKFNLSFKITDNDIYLFYAPFTPNIKYTVIINFIKTKSTNWMTRIITGNYQYQLESS